MSPAFVWRLEDVLDLDAEPPDPARSVVCPDERPVCLRDHARPPPPAPGRPAPDDSEYRRAGTARVAAAFGPHRGRRHATVAGRRTRLDFAGWPKDLADVHDPEAERTRLVPANITTHSPASLCAAFPPDEARRLARRFGFRHTPKHGSWLNMVEVEPSVLADQCLDRRLPSIEAVRDEVAAREAARNAARATVRWRSTTPAARTKLHRLYPRQPSWWCTRPGRASRERRCPVDGAVLGFAGFVGALVALVLAALRFGHDSRGERHEPPLGTAPEDGFAPANDRGRRSGRRERGLASRALALGVDWQKGAGA